MWYLNWQVTTKNNLTESMLFSYLIYFNFNEWNIQHDYFMLYISFGKNEIYQIGHYAQFTVISRSALRCVFCMVKNINLVFKPLCICLYCLIHIWIQLNIRARLFSELHYICRENSMAILFGSYLDFLAVLSKWRHKSSI